MGFEDLTTKYALSSAYSDPSLAMGKMWKPFAFRTDSIELFPTEMLPAGDIPQFSYTAPFSFDFSLYMPTMPSTNNMSAINNLIGNFNTYTQNNIAKLLESFTLALQSAKVEPQEKGANGGVAKQSGEHNHKITTLYKGTAADLNKELKGVLANKGKKFLELQKKYGISASVLAAIAMHESANGTSNAAKTKNNVAGIMTAESNWTELATFNSVDECLEAMAKNLKNNYADKGLVTISQIHAKYCPIGAENDPTGLNKNWGNGVASFTNKFENMA